jgi:hypothetical protein
MSAHASLTVILLAQHPYSILGPAISYFRSGHHPLKIASAMEDSDMSNIRFNRLDDLIDMTGKNQFPHGQPESHNHSGFNMGGQ